jgi:hypothetical protein
MGHTHYPLKHTPVDSRTGELILVAPELRQRDARCERRQRACVKRANQVSFEKKNATAGMSGTTLLVRHFYTSIRRNTRICTGELISEAIESLQLLALGERRQRACVKRANQVSFEKTEHNRL